MSPQRPDVMPVSPREELPLVSVIMPVRNEAAFLERSLGAVLAQDYPAERLEVIVADGMSTDGTREMLDAVRREHPNVRMVDNPKGIAPSALNAATAVARGDIIVRVDGHCEVAPDYVSTCVRHLQQDGVQGVGGSVETVGESAAARAIATAMSSSFGVGGTAFRTVQGRSLEADTIPFPAYPRAVIEAVGPYDEDLVRNQDDEYNYRIRKHGGRLLLAADVHSRYYSRAGLASLWRQYYGYGYFKVQVLRRHPRQMKARQFVPGLFVAALLAGLVAAPFSRRARRFLAAVLLSYAAASGWTSSRLAPRLEPRARPLLPAAFAVMHVGYGLGFLIAGGRLLAGRLGRGGR